MMKLKEMAWKKRISFQGKTLSYVNLLERWQWLDEKLITSMQQSKLVLLLRHAYQHVPYYQKLLSEAGVIDSDGNILLQHFEKIPILERGFFQSNFNQLQSDDLSERKYYENWSGGSTGEPIRLIQDKDYFDWNQAIKILFDQWSGRGLVDKQIILWASERDLMVGKESWKTYMGRWMRNERWWNTHRMSEKCLQAYADELNQFRPVQILAYVESLYELARFSEERQLSIYSPTAIMTTASMLYPHMRQTIERVFQAPIFNRYGSREIGAIACECDNHKGLHISAFTHYVEILRPDGTPARSGEQGELVITCLTNYAMPIIRYRIGDTAQWEEQHCTCGRALPMLKEITGRVTDLFIKKNGELVDGRLFVFLLGKVSFVKKFQIVQEEMDDIYIYIVPHEKRTVSQVAYQEELQETSNKIRILMGESCQIRIQFVDEIPSTASGKYRYTISKITR